MKDLYGDHVRPTYDTDPTRQPELFTAGGGTGSAWMRAAEAWASARGVPIVKWRANQQFKAPPRAGILARWYRVTWTQRGWLFEPA